MEELTEELYQTALGIITDVEEQGGMNASISSGWAKSKIEEVRKRARIARAELLFDSAAASNDLDPALFVNSLRPSQSATRKQGRIDSGEDVVVGVNKYRLEEDEETEVLKIDNDAVRKSQTARIEATKAGRDEAEAQECLKALTAAAEMKESTR